MLPTPVPYLLPPSATVPLAAALFERQPPAKLDLNLGYCPGPCYSHNMYIYIERERDDPKYLHFSCFRDPKSQTETIRVQSERQKKKKEKERGRESERKISTLGQKQELVF